ncbi:capsid staple protein [Atlantibacter hermannii]|uniref:capsid staple protein n=1 Tax=Atlantibacter hermannii TaxID=565 RepID=UPI0028A2C0E3|nr:hypothetical protein [Atlantibacter hermannii]
MELVNLKTGTDTYQDESGKTQSRDDYPWGLCINLDNETLKKLGATPQPVGSEVMITARAIIKSTSSRESEDGPRHDASLQITDMAIAAASQQEQKSAAETLYGTGGE